MRVALIAIVMVVWARTPAWAQASAAVTLEEHIEATIHTVPFDRGHWGIVVEDARTGERLYSRDADKLFIPASSMKLVVATAAGRLLGAGHRYSTTLHAAGPVENGVLDGDLIIRGSGDPTFSGRFYESSDGVWVALADSLASRGIQRIRGGIVADAGAWDATEVLGEWEAYDLLWYYAAPVAALGFNDNSIDFVVSPGAVGEPAMIEASPETSFYVLRNESVTVAAGAERTFDFDRVPGTDTILAYGGMPADAPVRTEHFAVHDPVRFAATTFLEALVRSGITVDDRAVRVVRQTMDADSVSPPLITWRSMPLDSVVRPILKSSHNWYAEQLLKTLGSEVADTGSWRAGLRVEREFLTDTIGIDSTAFVLRDGSGLSTGNLITPSALARLLRYVRTNPELDFVRGALPEPGEPETSLRSRLQDLSGRLQAKTGSMRNTVSLSGFVTDTAGRELVFVIMANTTGLSASATNRAIDDVVRAIANS